MLQANNVAEILSFMTIKKINVILIICFFNFNNFFFYNLEYTQNFTANINKVANK